MTAAILDSANSTAATAAASLGWTSHDDSDTRALDELRLAAAEVLALSSSLAPPAEGSARSRQLLEDHQPLHHGRVERPPSSATVSSAAQDSMAASSKQAAGGGGSASSNHSAKRRTKAGSISTADDSPAGADNPKAKRKKVSKACIFCKRSHMTCTENRPCERCIKRDIAHLCQDGPISGTPKKAPAAPPSKAPSSIAVSNAGSISEDGGGNDIRQASTSSDKKASSQGNRSNADASDTAPPPPSSTITANLAPASLSSLDDFPSATSAFAAPSFQQHHHQNRQQHQDQVEESRDRRTSTAPSATPLHGINNPLPTPTSTTSLLFGGSNLLEEPQSSSSYQQVHSSGRSSSHASHSQSPAFGHQQSQQHPASSILSGDGGNTTNQQQRHTPQSLNNLHLQGPTSSNSHNQQPQASGEQQQEGQQQQARPWNPFDILSQAYDFQYPPTNNQNYINNSLASLRLFATTADAQFGKPSAGYSGNSNPNSGYSGLGSAGGGGGMSGLSLLNGGNGGTFGSAGSENGTNSDIDGNALDEFLKSLDEMYLNPSPDMPQHTPSATTSALQDAGSSQAFPSGSADPEKPAHALSNSTTAAQLAARLETGVTNSTAPSRSLSPVLGAGHVAPSTSTERFLLTAADQKEGTRDERLNRVIRAKYDAGLLRPFNYIKGYERLNTWMERKWTASGKHRTLRIISEFRPHFRNIAQSLTDMDLIFIEEAFERLLLDYDRVFSTMGIPACLWRRTGEIFKGNKEFAALVGIPYEQLREGKLAIYELMTEDSAVNFWEKYGSIAFDPAQKAVLTSCVLVDQRKLKALQLKNSDSSVPTLNSLASTTPSNGGQSKDYVIPAASFSPSNIPEEARITCTFSFTIRRDAYHIPNAIVGNFMPYDPKKVRL